MSNSQLSFLQRLRGLLPSTERAANNRHHEIIQRINNLEVRFNKQFEEQDRQLQDRMKAFAEGNTTNTALTRLLLWELLREKDESYTATKKRFFESLPKATGSLRMLQLANAKLLHDFKAFCNDNNLPFFLVAGTLLGAVRHKGTIPWDDDLDVGMLRSDIEKLIDAVSQDERFEVAINYDQWVICKQVRFRYSDESIPCFVDVFYFDFAPDLSDDNNAQFERQRKALVKTVFELERSYIEDPNIVGDIDDFKLLSSTDPLSAPFEEAMTYAAESCLTANITCRTPDNAQYLRWGIENILTGKAPNLRIDDVYPLSEVEFEGELYPAPNSPEAVLECWFGNWLDLPNSAVSPFVHTDISENTVHSLKSFLEK